MSKSAAKSKQRQPDPQALSPAGPRLPANIEVVYVDASLLRAAEYNPRKMTEAAATQLLRSIQKFGLQEPLVVNRYEGRENILVGGHMRLRAAIALGYAKVPVVYVSLPLEQEQELNLRLNKNTGEWDWDMLANMFEQETLVEVGFSEQELGIGFGLNPADGKGTDPNAAWQGMPEFDQQDKTAFKSIVVHFKNQEAADAFSKLTGNPLTNRYMWFPEIEIEPVAELRYADES